METNINIAKIIKDKSVNTKLYSPLFGDVYTSSICNEDNDKEDQWSANIFSYQVRDMFHCLGENYWRYCIPYAGNEHLLGTTKNVEG